MIKRSADIVFAAILLLLTLPVLLLAALLIRISSPGPVLFRQQRMGRGFRPFEILKFRTMAHAEAGLAYTLGPDPRITPVGRLLRRMKLDELPQLWNVMRGEMSMVGPRPVLPELACEFHVHYTLLLRERPGLTDPASIKYSQEARLLATVHDPMRYFKTVVTPDKIRISLEYMDRATFWTDGATIAMTALVCCVPSLSRLNGELPAQRTDNVAYSTSSSTLQSSPSAPLFVEMPVHIARHIHAHESSPTSIRGGTITGQSGNAPWNMPQIHASDAQSTANDSPGRIMQL